MFSAFWMHQCPRVQIITTCTLSALATSLTPAAAGISDFADIDELEERLNGSSERYTTVDRVDKLSQRAMGDRLLEFNWRNDTFYFVGATTARDLRITYASSGSAPSSGSINVDNSLSFLSNYAAGVAGPRKGYDELADRCMRMAVGPRYAEGIIGGQLWQLIQPRVRSMQNVQIAPRPYGYERRLSRRRVPYVAAQQPQGVGVAPVQFSYFAGTITGTLDGVNATFYLPYPVTTAEAVLNGSELTRDQQFTHAANVITFIAPYIPQPGADILVKGWL